MTQYIDKDALVTGIEKLISIGKLKCQQSQENKDRESYIAWSEHIATYKKILSLINTLEVKDPYKQQYIQYDFIKAGIQAHAETYSSKIESELFTQLAKEQQSLWRKEIEQACVSGGEVGYELAIDSQYKESLKMKEANLNEEIESYFKGFGKFPSVGIDDCIDIAKHFFELGFKVTQKGEKV